MIWPWSFCAFDLHLQSTSWSLSSPTWHHDLHHLDLYQHVVTWSSRQLLLLQLLLSHNDKLKQLYGSCILCNKQTTISLLPVVDNFKKHDHLIQQFIYHHFLTISNHNMPCKNKLDVLYFLLQVLRGCYGLSKNRSYLRIKTTTIFRQVCADLTFNKDRA